MRCLAAIALFCAGPAFADDAPRYRHQSHAERFNVKAKCGVCHQSSANGRLTWPGADDHQPCSACHQEYQRRPATEAGKGLVVGFCQTCHVHSDPWRANPVRQRFSPDSEFTVRFPHGRVEHRAAPCVKCHPGPAGKRTPLPPPGHTAPGHRLCGDCHQKLARPPMTDCAGCHRLGGDPAVVAANAWRVGARFQHRTHRTDAAGKPVDCAACHVVEGDAMGRPDMRACAACHDGARAFKVTGHDCGRCHLQGERTL